MKEQLEQRLQSLKTEYESGQKMLAELKTKQTNLQEILLRINGAIQVLEEALQNAEETDTQTTIEDNHHHSSDEVISEAIPVASVLAELDE